MKLVRRDILRLIQTYIQKEQDKTYQVFYTNFLPQLKLLIDDYQQASPDARDPEVLLMFSTMVKQMGENLSNEIPAIIDGLCNSTLTMVQSDFLSLPEFREGFFNLTMNIIKHGTTALFNLPQQAFQQMVMVVIFAM